MKRIMPSRMLSRKQKNWRWVLKTDREGGLAERLKEGQFKGRERQQKKLSPLWGSA